MTLIEHPASGLLCDVDRGVVYGKQTKRPVGHDTGNGYLSVATGPNSARNRHAVHRLIYEAAHGAIPTGLEINHINGVKTDNRIANLEAVTRRENLLHARATGLNKGRQRALSDEQIKWVREASKTMSHRELAERMGVGRTTISRYIREQHGDDHADQ